MAEVIPVASLTRAHDDVDEAVASLFLAIMMGE